MESSLISNQYGPTPTRRTVLTGIAVGGATALAGCTAPTASSGGTVTTTIDAVLADYSIELSRMSAPAGRIVFNVENTAEQIHEFVVIRSGLAPDSLPTDENDDVDESEVTVLGEIEDLEGGASEKLPLTLEAGQYVLICNLPAHYRLGMYTGLTVG